MKLVLERKGRVDEEKRKHMERVVRKRSGRNERLSWPFMIGWCGGNMSITTMKLLAAANIPVTTTLIQSWDFECQVHLLNKNQKKKKKKVEESVA